MNDKPLGACQCHEKRDADDFKYVNFAMHPVTGSVAAKNRMDWKWVLPGWYDTGDVSRLSDQQMADAGWSPVRECPDRGLHATGRPLTPDAITDEARDRAYRAVAALSVCDWDDMSGVAKGRAMALVEAVITEITRPEPPTRPEGAEEWEDWLIEALPHESMPDEDIARLADQIAARAARRDEDPSGPLRPLTTDERSYRYAQDLGYELPEDPR